MRLLLFYLLDLVCITKYSANQVAGYAIGGGHVLHLVCDLTIAADNAIFGQTGPKVMLSDPFIIVIFELRVSICVLVPIKCAKVHRK